MNKLCGNCFSEKKSKVCPVCGYSGGSGNNTGNALRRGTKLGGHYKVGGVIGSGSFGITYITYDLKNKSSAAVKEYFPRLIAVRDENGSVRYSAEKYGDIYRRGAEEFYLEAEYVFQFNGNPNIVSVYDYFYENNTAYVVMEYLSGITLENYIKKYGTLSDEQIVCIAEKILMALITVHSAQLLHRDVSPDNIMLCADGKIKLIDFGAARRLTSDSLPELTVIMKDGFTPAEQYMRNGSFGEWTDIYSLGAVLYYAVTGSVPDNPYERMINNSELDFCGKPADPALRNIICKAVSISAAQRYRSAAEMKKAVSELKIKSCEIKLPNNFELFGVRSFSSTAPTGYSVGKKLKYLLYGAAGTLAVLTAFIFGTALHSENISDNYAGEKYLSADSKNTEEMPPNTSQDEFGKINNTYNTIKIEFDGTPRELYEFDGNIPAGLLESFGGDVEITYFFTVQDTSWTAGLIPSDSEGNYMIKHITGEYICAQEHGWINIDRDAESFSFTLSREGIESLGGNDFGIFNYDLLLSSAEIKEGSRQNPVSYCSYTTIDYLEPTVSEKNGEKIVFADFTDTDYAIKRYPNEWNGYTTWGIPKFAFDEFDGDISVTLDIEHINTEENSNSIFYVYDCGMNPDPIYKSIILSEEKDKFGNYLTSRAFDGVCVSKTITKCSFVIPRESAENMLGGIHFGEDHIRINSVQIKSADKENINGNTSDRKKTV